MKAQRPLAVVFFETETGNEPVREWLKSLSKDARKSIGADILAVQYGWPVGKPLGAHLAEGIWEIRSRLRDSIARTLFIEVDQVIVLLHGFIKKSQKTPKADLDLARLRRRKYLAHEKQT